MKKAIIILGVLGTLTTLPSFVNKVYYQPAYKDTFEMRKIKNTAFTYGEKMNYRVHYGFVNAGYIDIKVQDQPVMINGRPTYHIDGYGRSRSGFDWMFKVRDHFESYVDTQGILPLQFVKNQKEGGYEDHDFVIFDHKLKKYFGKKGSNATTPDIQDVLSVAYYARTVDVKNSPVGTTFTLNVYMDNKIYPLIFKIDGREVLDTDIGEVNAIRVIPEVVADGRVFKDKNSLKVWVSDDENKLPLRIQADLMVGSIKADITDYSGLRNALNFKK